MLNIQSRDFILSDMKDIDDDLSKVDDDLIEILSKLFAIENTKRCSIITYFKNIFIPFIYAHKPLIKNYFLEVINCLEIIKSQIVPITFFRRNLISQSFRYMIIDNESTESSNEISISTNLPKKKEIFIQIIPNGLLSYSGLCVLLNDKPIEEDQILFNSYVKINNMHKVKISFQNCPIKLIFIQVLIYKKLTQKQLEDHLRKKLNIPNDVLNSKAQIQHNGHFFQLSKLLNSFKTNDCETIICPICKAKADQIYYSDARNDDSILDSILDDNDYRLFELFETFKYKHIFISSHKMPKILRDLPTFISLCGYFGSIKCFNRLFELYSSTKDESYIHQPDQKGRLLIHFACHGGNLEIIQSLLFFFENSKCKDYFGLTPIHYAAMGGKIEVIKFFNENKHYMFDCENLYSQTPLHIACQFGYLNIVKYYCETIIPNCEFDDFDDFLLKVCNPGENKITPLHTACMFGQNEIVKYFLSNPDYSRNQFDFIPSKSPLILACESGNEDCVKELLEFNPKYDSTNIEIWKSFNRSIINGYYNIIKLLFSKFNVPIYSIAILEAINNGNINIAKFLINNCSNNDKSISPLISFWKSSILFKDVDSETQNAQFHENKTSENPQLRENEATENLQLSENEATENPQLSENEATENPQLHEDEATENPQLHEDEATENPQLHEDEATENPQLHESEESENPHLQRNVAFNNFIPQKFIPLPFESNSGRRWNEQRRMQIDFVPKIADPSEIGYFKSYNENGPKTFTDLLNYTFSTKDQLKFAVRNISIIDHRSIFISKSEENRIIYKCSKCQFYMTWKFNDNKWHCINDTFINHTCLAQDSKKPSFHASDIDYAIQKMSLSCANTNSSLSILSNFFESTVSKRNLTRRIHHNQFFNAPNWWQLLPSYLANNITNGGLSELKVTPENNIYCFAMVPQYAVLLLKSEAILPVILIDGTFQSSIYRGTIIIVMIVSSNRTNIPVGWAWGPSENEETICSILNLIKQINDKIETIITDEGIALKSAIKEIFPDSTHRLCAWHIAKSIKDAKIRKLFWEIIQSDHPIIFRSRLAEFFQAYQNDLPDSFKSDKISGFATFFEGTKANGLKTSSPCESINADIKHLKNEHPLKVFHQLEIIGFTRCIDLLSIQSIMTPYFEKRKEHLIEKTKSLQIVEEESYGTHRTVVDLNYPHPQIRWEVDSRTYFCCCGKYSDRCFPCAHMFKVLQHLQLPIENYVHKCYFMKTIKDALKDMNQPVPLSFLEEDHDILPPPSRPRNGKNTRYLFSFERNRNNQ